MLNAKNETYLPAALVVASVGEEFRAKVCPDCCPRITSLLYINGVSYMLSIFGRRAAPFCFIFVSILKSSPPMNAPCNCLSHPSV